MSEATPIRYEQKAVSTESTVVAEFVPDPVAIDAYQSEAALEVEFIRLLKGLPSTRSWRSSPGIASLPPIGCCW